MTEFSSPSPESTSGPSEPSVDSPARLALEGLLAGAHLSDDGPVVSTLASPAAQLKQEAHIVGLKGFSTPTLEAVDRRRSQLWTIAFAGLVSLSVAVSILTSGGAHHLGFANRTGFRIGTVLLVTGLAVYVVEKERHLRRLAALLVEERVLAAGLSNRLKELALLYEAGKAMNSVLVVDEVLELILSSAFELLQASSGSILLVDDAGDLREVCRAGTEEFTLGLTEGMARRVVADREPLLAQGKVIEKGSVETQSTVCVPLVHRGQTLGALSLSGKADHTYSEHDLRAVSLFAEHAAVAVANARLYEAERMLSAQLSQQGFQDPLTTAADRVLITEKLTECLAHVGRNESAVGVLFIDIDDFRLVNDEFGPGVGDIVLASLAERISSCVRPEDVVGRIGSDAFVIVCEQLSIGEGVPERIANRILAELRTPVNTPFGERSFTASIGIAHSTPANVLSPDELLHAAEGAMYKAKMDGKARIVRSST